MKQVKKSKQSKRDAIIHKEIMALEKKEEKMLAAAKNTTTPAWKLVVENKVPEKIYNGLESAFAKGFSLVFQKGKALIEKTYNKDEIQADHAIRNFAVYIKGGKKEIRQVSRSATNVNAVNMTITTLEGVALGALGIGMPDVVLFLTALIKGIYETALSFGFTYDKPEDKYLILKMMETALSSGEDWERLNREVNEEMSTQLNITEEQLQLQMEKTASAFAMDMLLLKFIQGIPVVGIIGGAANPYYYSKVMRYVRLKYNKQYLIQVCTSPIADAANTALTQQ